MNTSTAIKKQKIIRLVNEMNHFGISIDDVLEHQKKSTAILVVHNSFDYAVPTWLFSSQEEAKAKLKGLYEAEIEEAAATQDDDVTVTWTMSEDGRHAELKKELHLLDQVDVTTWDIGDLQN